ncbi:YcjF family protein [Botrimarina hoheduenensis]|uniref:tRNA modification GTPase MnmE n=1 Tax=Botrimarina hoheduenensis TaxID=2528000 RepID=A0A5C5W8U1_9BACT|nr:DUF697 domain-containing protein [Botrimarina hoheduenensis]TWT46449.1 tRNA modification GTPase MnmE [Botrimarina hoheduenensis]
MIPRRPSKALLILAAVAALGYVLVTVPPRVVAQYNAAHEISPWVAWAYLGVVGVGAVLLIGLAVWGGWRLWWNTIGKRRQLERRGKNPSQMSRTARAEELRDNLAASREYALGIDVRPQLRAEIERAIADLESRREVRELCIVAFGTISSGKSSLLNALAGREAFRSDVIGGTTVTQQRVPWPDSDSVVLIDTPGLAEVEGEGRAANAADAAEDADLVLFVVDGPLKAYEHALLERLAAMEKRLVLCLNKADWFSPTEQQALLGQLVEQTTGLVQRGDVVPVRSRPTKRPIVRVAADGAQEHDELAVPADIGPLADRLLTIVRSEGGDLLVANLLMQSRGLVDEAKQRVLATLDEEADRIIDRYMWASGGAAAVNPIPLLDLAVSTGIVVKMVLDLAEVYKQKIDVDTVVEMLAQLGKNLIAMLGVSAAAPALGAALGSLLKTVPGVGWIAGGLLQGTVQALVTRWIGRIFRAYYRADMQTPPGGLAEIARREWAHVTQPDELRKLVRRGRSKIDAPPADKANSNAEDPTPGR